MGYWPQAVPLNTTPDVIEGDVWHGLSHPSLPAQAPDAPREVSKNAPTAIADLFAATDLDGDPVSVTVTAQPVHGVINGTTFTPAATFAGVDATTLQASDGYNLATSATYAIDVVNHAPLFDGVSPMVINEGSAVDVVVHAADQDASDVVHYALGSVPSALRNSVTLVGQSLHIAIPAGVRPAGTLSIDVLATDTTTPPLEVGSDTLSIGFTIKPLVRAPTVALTATTPSGHTVQLNAKAVWPDPGASCLGAGCHWSFVWDFGDGTTTSTTTSAVNHSYRRPGRYTPSVSATVVGYYVAVPAVSDRMSNELVIADDARTLLFVRTRATKRTLTVTIQARRGAGLQVAVRVDGRTLTRKITVAGGTGESFGAARSVTFSLRGVRSRVAEVVVSFTGDLAGDPPPSPLRRLVWLR